jgi:hypothetical protein
MAGSNKLTSPVEYVDNYDRMSPNMHPSARAEMDPSVDAIERSQIMRGARKTGPDFEENEVMNIMDSAMEMGWKPSSEKPTPEDFAAAFKAAASNPDMQTDENIALIVRAAKTYGIPNPFSGRAPNPLTRPKDGDYVFGGQRPTNLQMNSEQPEINDAAGNQDPEPYGYRVKPTGRY